MSSHQPVNNIPLTKEVRKIQNLLFPDPKAVNCFTFVVIKMFPSSKKEKEDEAARKEQFRDLLSQ